jgi:hypoxanthine phosphoribosyltransferase
VEHLQSLNPQSIKICTLLDKPYRREVNVNIDYSGFEIPNLFVVGYGLDYGQMYRNLPYIAVLESTQKN